MSISKAAPTSIGQSIADRIESDCLHMDQIDAPVLHFFGPGIYIRQVTMPAGSMVVGHHHRLQHLNIMVSGRLALLDDDKPARLLDAPQVFTSPPGRKVAIILKDTIWQNVIATDETDLEKIDKMMFDKTALWAANAEVLQQAEHIRREPDRSDFAAFLSESDLDDQTVREMSERTDDMMPFPEHSAPKFTIRPSQIEGRGAFACSPCVTNEVIAPARIAGRRTPAGRFVNHSVDSNAFFSLIANGDIFLIARRPIGGCVGSNNGEEITVDYRQALAVNLRSHR